MAVVQTTKASTFNSMINEYLPYDLLMKEFEERNWLLKTANMKEGWLGDNLIIPYQSTLASSVKMGGLTAANDIAEAEFVRGQLTGYKECWATLLFQSRDLLEHDKVSEKNFLRLMPDQLEQSMTYMKELVSSAVLNVQQIADISSITTAGGAATLGVIVISNPEAVRIGQKVLLRDAATTEEEAYIISINMNNGSIEVADTRGGTEYNPALTVTATGGGVYLPDTYNSTTNNGFTSLLQQVLPSGYLNAPATVFGQTKTSSPFTQGLIYDAADWANGTPSTGAQGAGNLITAHTDILAQIFNALAKARQRKANPTTFLMSYKHFSACLTALEYGGGSSSTQGSGAFKNVTDKVDYAGFSEISVGSLMGSVKLVAINEMTDKVILGIDEKKLDFHTNKGFMIQESPDGLKFYSVRNTTGYQYIIDICFYGDFVYSQPWTSIAMTMPTTYTGIPNFNI